MEGQTEKGPERIPSREEVLEAISRFAENAQVIRELADEQGIYLLEAKVEGEIGGESTQYEYRRKGKFPNGQDSSVTVIHRVFYEGDMPVGGGNVAELNIETGEWDEVQ